ncbi:MAG: LiaI-LiaF-like domain-containing protein [Chloroflexota bacterium]
MTDMPTGSTDPSPTTSGVDLGSHLAAPAIGPATGVSPVHAPTAPGPSIGRRRDDPGRTATVVFGLILVAIGLWFFADQTLGIEMPRLRWSELWPVLLILLGAWILLSAMRRRR